MTTRRRAGCVLSSGRARCTRFRRPPQGPAPRLGCGARAPPPWPARRRPRRPSCRTPARVLRAPAASRRRRGGEARDRGRRRTSRWPGSIVTSRRNHGPRVTIAQARSATPARVTPTPRPSVHHVFAPARSAGMRAPITTAISMPARAARDRDRFRPAVGGCDAVTAHEQERLRSAPQQAAVPRGRVRRRWRRPRPHEHGHGAADDLAAAGSWSSHGMALGVVGGGDLGREAGVVDQQAPVGHERAPSLAACRPASTYGVTAGPLTPAAVGLGQRAPRSAPRSRRRRAPPPSATGCTTSRPVRRANPQWAAAAAATVSASSARSAELVRALGDVEEREACPCGSRSRARRASRASRAWPGCRAATSPRSRPRTPRCGRSRSRSAETSSECSQPRCTPPIPPVAMKWIPAMAHTASVPATVVAPHAPETAQVARSRPPTLRTSSVVGEPVDGGVVEADP